MPELLPVLIIGGGPAGLMAAEVLSAAGVPVTLCEAMPTVGRKLLMAGRGGLNLTHSEDPRLFMTRFRCAGAAPVPLLLDALGAFPADAVRQWADGLGAETFVGSSGRVFPKIMKAAPLLRAWLRRLDAQGVQFRLRHRWTGWTQDAPGMYPMHFATPDGETTVPASTVLLALGGASWPRLGSDGGGVAWLAQQGVAVQAFKPANCGFECDWSAYLVGKFAGTPLKQVRLVHADPQSGVTHEKLGDCVLTRYGLEGGAIYALSATLRDRIERDGVAPLHLDLLPQLSETEITARLARRGSRSLSSFLPAQLGLKGVKLALLHEVLPASGRNDPQQLARAIKSLPLRLRAPRPLAEAISSAGGVDFAALGPDFQLQALPGVFCAGEMLDWEAPTGGYLLTACLATGHAAGQHILNHLRAAHV